jgi:hypothetical protein
VKFRLGFKSIIFAVCAIALIRRICKPSRNEQIYCAAMEPQRVMHGRHIAFADIHSAAWTA